MTVWPFDGIIKNIVKYQLSAHIVKSLTIFWVLKKSNCTKIGIA
jgi:hypothetical protein